VSPRLGSWVRSLPSSNDRTFDVLIAGGGPAGCATALSLRIHAPGLSIALIEQTGYASARPGEVLPGAARKLLENLGIQEAFEREPWRAVHASASAWGAPVLRENHSIYSGSGNGWHLDRAKFDRFLAMQAEASGVEVLTEVRAGNLERTEGGWRLDLAPGPGVQSRFIVDSTGRAASIARQIGAPPVSLDPLIAFSRFFHADAESDPRTLIEAVADGWWYTAALTGNQRVATFMTDPGVARQSRLDRESSWREALAQTQFMESAVPVASSIGNVVRHAGSSYLEEPAGDNWLAVGDAACAHDPLSGQGITRALRSGILASFAIADSLCGKSSLGIKRYRYLCRHGWYGYLEARRRFYLEEKRWAERSFWRRRHNGNL
jgi:flavin-dependent dehydrogenase